MTVCGHFSHANTPLRVESHHCVQQSVLECIVTMHIILLYNIKTCTVRNSIPNILPSPHKNSGLRDYILPTLLISFYSLAPSSPLSPPPPLTDLRARSTECGGGLLQSESSGVTACTDCRPRLRPLPGGRGYSTGCRVWRCSLLLSCVLYSSLQQWLMLCCSCSYKYKFVEILYYYI